MGGPAMTRRGLGDNVDVRKVLLGLGATITALAVAAAGVDFGAAIFAEYRLARSVRTAAHLSWDPTAVILGFPFIPQAMRGRYDELEIKANDVEHPMVGKASLEATMHAIDLSESSWLIGPDAKLRVGKLESRIIIDSAHLGRFIGVKDLIVEAPSRETNDATGGTTESGISDSHGLVFTGTPTAAHFDKRVSVSVDLTLVGPDKSTLVFTPTDVVTGPGTADQAVPDDRRADVLDAFQSTLPDQILPFGIAPTSQGARGSDVIVEGIAEELTITLDGFKQS